MIYYTELANRGILKISGSDRLEFLQGLLTNDVSRLASDSSFYSLLLTPQGKHAFDLFLTAVGDEWWIEADRHRLEELKQRLSLYKLRSQVSLDIDLTQRVFACWGSGAAKAFKLDGNVLGCTRHELSWYVYMDPRHAALGVRVIAATDRVPDLGDFLGNPMSELADYQYHRYGLGVPETDAELLVNKSIPLENGMDELNAIDWQKGCYMGQELTSRTRYRGLVRKRLFPIVINGDVDLEKPIMAGEAEVGAWRAHCRDRGLALIRLEALGKQLTCGDVEVIVSQPDWMILPKSQELS